MDERAAVRLPTGVRWAGQAGLFLAAFIPRALYPVSRPLQWYERSFRFVDAVFSGQWAATVVSEHPGVAPMWLIGLSQHAYYRVATLLGRRPPHPLDVTSRAFESEVAISILPLALVVALGVLLAWRLLRDLFGEPVAWAGMGFLALDPFHIAISKVVHVDALLSVLMVLSALSTLRYWQLDADSTEVRCTAWPRYRILLASGLLAGLAFLTKSPAYFLIPFFGLSLLVMSIGRPGGFRHAVKRALVPAVVWIAAAVVVYILLWPAMWVQPAQTLTAVFGGVLKHAGRAHPQPIYYLGELTTEDPGPAFYLLTILVKATLLTLPLSVVGVAAAASGAWRRGRRALWLLVAYGLFFFVQMSLGAKKDPRYVLPIFPALDILAGVGLVVLVRWWTRPRPTASRALIIAALAVQAALVWPYHPYYVTYASPLVGGPAGAQRLLVATPESEGLDLVARYLNRQPGAERLRVGVQLPAREAFRQIFVGEVLDTREADLDYLVFADVYLKRHVAEDQWGEQWRAVRFHAPEFVARLHGIPYARLYRVQDGPQHPATALSVRLGEQIRLLGTTLLAEDGKVVEQHTVIHPGDALLLTLHWAASGEPGGDYSVFVHLLGPDGGMVTQQDNVPLNGAYSTLLWREGTRVDDPYELRVPEGALEGRYTLVAGMYDWRSGERLAVRDDRGIEAAENYILLARVDVEGEHVPWWQPVAWATALLVLAAGLASCALWERGLSG